MLFVLLIHIMFILYYYGVGLAFTYYLLDFISSWWS